jgi:hypothetical protein
MVVVVVVGGGVAEVDGFAVAAAIAARHSK